jgi:hypothetical protein
MCVGFEEVAMAAITFNAEHRVEHVRKRIQTALASLHEILDAFVCYRIRLTATAAEYPLSTAGPGHAVNDRTMSAVQLAGPDLSPQQAPGRPFAPGEHAGISPVGEPATAAVQFRPLDSDIVNDAIPAFFIGRNKDGFWVAREAKGSIGGIFLLEISALAFARKNSEPVGSATIFPSERFELDLENNGNPLVGWLGRLMRVAMRARRRIAGLIGG